MSVAENFTQPWSASAAPVSSPWRSSGVTEAGPQQGRTRPLPQSVLLTKTDSPSVSLIRSRRKPLAMCLTNLALTCPGGGQHHPVGCYNDIATRLLLGPPPAAGWLAGWLPHDRSLPIPGQPSRLSALSALASLHAINRRNCFDGWKCVSHCAL